MPMILLDQPIVYQCVAPATLDGGEGLLAVLIPAKLRCKEESRFVTDPQSEQQVGVLTHKSGWTSAPHYHPEQRRVINRTTEVLIIRSGVLRLDLYSMETKELINSYRLQAGDTAILLGGAHSVTALTDVQLLEVKQGPYNKTTDKVLLNVK